jgi:hypothetical protein
MLTREWLVALTVTPNVVMTFVPDKMRKGMHYQETSLCFKWLKWDNA